MDFSKPAYPSLSKWGNGISVTDLDNVNLGSIPGTFTVSGHVPHNGKVTLTWGAATDAVYYIVKYGTTSGVYTTTFTSSGTSPLDVTGLTNDTLYYFQVTAANPYGTRAATEVSATPITVPGHFSITDATAGDTKVTLTWGASHDATSYTVKYGTVTGVYPTTFTTSGTSPLDVTGLTNGTPYFFMVIGVNSEGSTNANAEATATPASAGFAATGGTITTSGGNTIHTFTSSGNFVVTSGSGSVDALIIAGGGGGGGVNYGGGGGAGGMQEVTGISVDSGTGTYAVVVGAGGTANAFPVDSTNGGNSSFGGTTSVGGGASITTGGGADGGSGGGKWRASGGEHTGAGTSGQGHDGGASPGTNAGSGGGGAGTAGGNATGGGVVGGVGGDGSSSSYSGSAVTYAGGGGGGGSNDGGAAGSGGGGTGGFPGTVATAGTANTGGGGGGGGNVADTNKGANGGSGIVIIRYPTP